MVNVNRWLQHRAPKKQRANEWPSLREVIGQSFDNLFSLNANPWIVFNPLYNMEPVCFHLEVLDTRIHQKSEKKNRNFF